MSTSAHGFEAREVAVNDRRRPGGRGWREGGPSTFTRLGFLAVVAWLGLTAFHRIAGPAGAAEGAATAAAAPRCPQDTGLQLRLPPGHPPVPGYGAPALPPGHPPVGGSPAGPLFPQDAPRTL